MNKKIQKVKWKNIKYNLKQILKSMKKFTPQKGAPLMGVAVSSNAGEWATYYGYDPVHEDTKQAKKELKKKCKCHNNDVLDTPTKCQRRARDLRCKKMNKY